MPRRKTHAEFVAEVEALVGDEYSVIGEYKNSYTKLKMKHNECSHEYEVRPNSFLRGDRCPKCFGNEKKTTDVFIQEVFELVGNEYLVLGEYKNAYSKLKMKHNECSHEYHVKPNDFLMGIRCPKCFRSKKKTTDTFKQEVFELVGNEYSVLGEYKNSKKKIRMKHNKCFHEYEVVPNSFLTGCRCPECFGATKKTTGVFKHEVFELVGNEYLVLGEYKSRGLKIKMKHCKCSHEYEVIPASFLSGSRCPKCNESKGERAIEESLTRLRISHDRQYKFDDCLYKRSLPFDFAVFNADNSIKCLIEYDGEYHYIPKKHAGGEKGLHYRKRCDAIKTKYCADHNIPLIRIPYWEFDNIDAILTKELRKLGVIETEVLISA